MRRRPPSPSYLAESGTWTLPLADPWGVTQQQVDQPQPPTDECIEETASIHLHHGGASDLPEDCATSATGALETGGPEASPLMLRKKKKKKEKEHNNKKKSERKKRDEAPPPPLPLDNGAGSTSTTTTSSATTSGSSSTSSSTTATTTATSDAAHQGLRRHSREVPAPTSAPAKKKSNKEHKQQQRAQKHGRHREHGAVAVVDKDCTREGGGSDLEYAGADCFGGGGGDGGVGDEAGAVGRRRMRRRGGSLEMLPSERRSRELRMSGIDEAMLRSILEDIDVHASAAATAINEALTSTHSEPEGALATVVETAASAAVGSGDHCDAAAAHKTATARQKRKQKLSSKSDDDMNRTYVGMFPRGKTTKPAGGGASRKRSSNKPQPQPQPSDISPASSPPPASTASTTQTTPTATQPSGGFMRKLRNDALSRSLDLIPNLFAQKPTAAAATTVECVDTPTTERDDTAAPASTPPVMVVVDKRANKKRAGSLGRSATERTKDDVSEDVAAVAAVAAAVATPPAAAVGPIKNEQQQQQRKKDRKRAKKSQTEDELRATLEPKAIAGFSPRSEAASGGPPDVADPILATAAANAAGDQAAEEPQPPPEPGADKPPLSVASSPKPARPKSAIEKAKKTVGDGGTDKSAGGIRRRSSYDRSPITAAGVEGSAPAPAAAAAPASLEQPVPTTTVVVRSPPTSPHTAKEKRRRSVSTKDSCAGGAGTGPLKQLKSSDVAASPASAAVARKMSMTSTTTPTGLDTSHSLASSTSTAMRPSPESLRLPLAKLEALRTDGESSAGPGGAQARLTTTKRAMVASPSSPAGGGGADVSDEDEPSLEDSYGVYLMKRMKHRKKRKKRKKQAKGLARVGGGNEAEAEGDDEGDEVFFAHLKSGFENYRITADPLLPSSPPLPLPLALNADPDPDPDTAAPESPVKKKKKKKKLRVKIEVAAGEEGEGDEGDNFEDHHRGRGHDRQHNHGNDAGDDVGDANAPAGNAAAASVADEKGERTAASRRTSRQFSDSPSARSRMLGAPPRRSLSDTNLRATYLADQRRQESLKEKRRKLRRSRSINLLELYKAKHTTRKERPVVPLTELRPTQFTVGMLAVSHQTKKINKMAKTCGEAKLIKYIGKKTVPVVVGPEHRFYMLDRHHAARALWDSEVDANLKVLHVQILADLSSLSQDEFWDKMKRNKCTYLTKHGQDPLSPDLLPPNVGELSDDSYRSLAWAVKSRKGFKATSIPFAEFIWADFLREQLRKELGGEEDIYAVVGEAIDACHSACAAHLPGYIAPPPPPDDVATASSPPP